MNLALKFPAMLMSVTLILSAAALTVYSFGVYLYRNRGLFSDRLH